MSISFRKLVNAKCKQCTYDPHGVGNWRQQVGACTVKSCPLWDARPRSEPRVSTEVRSPDGGPGDAV
jgi:hypothetical protein